jgi:GNAT superfamily N-acetyltransferase
MMLRRVSGQDFDSIYGLLRLLGDSGPFVELKYVLQNLLADPQRELVLVTNERDQAVGLMCLHQGSGPGCAPCKVTVQEMMIHPRYVDHGIEERLLRFAEQYSRSREGSLQGPEGGERAKGVIRRNFEHGSRRCRKAMINGA